MSFNFSHVDLTKGLRQIPEAFKVLISTPAFIKKHQLWKGFWEHSWVLVFSVLIAVAFTYILYNNIHDYFLPNSEENIEINIPSEGIAEGGEAVKETVSHIPDDADSDLEAEEKSITKVKESLEDERKSLFSGSLKFLLLIFLEVLIFHFSVRTNNILKNKNKVLKFKDFSKAQIRMTKVMIRKWIYGLIMFILISILCGITGTDYLKDFIMFLIYGYYMGFAFLDNYLEQFKFSINESVKCVQSHFGAATVFGLFASIVMSIPIIGPLIVPFLCAIAAARYGHISQMEAFPKVRKVAA